MPHHRRGRRRRHGSGGARRRGRGGGGRGRGRRGRRARWLVQCRRAAAFGVRRPVRSCRGDGDRGGNQGEHAGAEVPPGRARGGRRDMTDRGFLRVLAVDDEPPALDELAYLLRADPRVARLHTAADATEALRVLRDTDVDVVFLDIRMPGLDGMELARVLRRFARPPAIVFVTAYDDGAVDAFDLGVADYVRKPVQADRLSESVRRVVSARVVPTHPAALARARAEEDPTIPVELAGTTRMLPRSAVRW